MAKNWTWGLTSFLTLIGCAAVQRPDGGSGLLAEGSAPPSALYGIDQSGHKVTLSDLHGQFAVVYFYPKDNTPGCTKEACAFRDVWSRYQARNVQVIGVSNNDVSAHQAFANQHSLPFPLVADTDASWAKAFGVSGFAGMYSRVTFLLTPNGEVGKVYKEVDPGVHATQVLADIESLSRNAP